jgi:Spy/CpxP family protein refolding chaperone
VSAANPPLSEPERRAKRVAEFTKELSLTPQQSQQLDAILMQRHAETKAIHDQTDAQLDAVRQKGRAQVRAILTPDQLPKFEEFLKRMDEERKRNGPPPR